LLWMRCFLCGTLEHIEIVETWWKDHGRIMEGSWKDELLGTPEKAPLSFQQVLGLGSSSSQQRNSVWASTGGLFQISCIILYPFKLLHFICVYFNLLKFTTSYSVQSWALPNAKKPPLSKTQASSQAESGCCSDGRNWGNRFAASLGSFPYKPMLQVNVRSC
jgi:hypothetical protein